MNILSPYDIKLFYWLNSFAFQADRLDAVIVFRARYSGYIICAAVLIFIAATFLKRYERFRSRAIEAGALAFSSAIVARWVIKPLITLVYDRARPYDVLPMVKKLFEDSTSAFPSGHALFFFALATGVYFYYPKTSILFFLAAFSITAARVMAGVHWPSDVLAGAIIGVLGAWFMKYIFWKFLHKK